MKKQLIILVILGTLVSLTACSPPKDRPKKDHEGKREWTVPQTPDDASVTPSEFSEFDVDAGYKAVQDPSGNLLRDILIPLSKIVLNKRFIENPQYRTSRMSQMIQIFNRAFLKLLEAKDQSEGFKAIKAAHYATLFSGCSGDLRRDCINDGVFSDDGYHTRIMTRLAQELDAELDALIDQAGAPGKCVEENAQCRRLLEERYRRLAMGLRKRNRNYDGDFAFAYLKHARALAFLIAYDRTHEAPGDDTDLSTSYLAEMHSSIFKTLISHYQPQNINDPEFKKFVENFNPWGYSSKRADIFQHGARIMFEFGTKCCLYEEGTNRTKISQAVKDAIAESQKEADSFGPTFQEMIKSIKTKFPDNRIFKNLGMLGILPQLENVNSSFYNEYFLVVDRLFRSHLNTSEIEMILNNAPTERTQAELPKMITTYLKVYLIHMVVETNVYMAQIYNSSAISSDKVFEEATTRSRELTSRWHTIQSQIDLLDRAMGSYFKGRNLESRSPEYQEANRLIKSVNRNIHYLSVYPNMIVMTYFLSKMKGSLTIYTWFGPITINADIILDAFFDGGMESPWFRFGKDPEPLDRHMLLYGFEYMLSTDALGEFSAKEGAAQGEDERYKFFDLIFSKYLDDNIHDLRKQVNEYDRSFFGSTLYSSMNALCDYEEGKTATAPAVQLNLLDISRYTYGGVGSNGVNSLLQKFNKEPGDAFRVLRAQIDSRLTYMRALIDIVENDLIGREKIKKAGEPHPETAKAYAMIKEMDGLKAYIAKSFQLRHKRYLDCSLRLQEIERRRMNRLYEEERAHLGQIFDLIKPLVRITDDAARDAKIKEINANYFRKEGSGYRFDSINGLAYRMSKYDMLKRMQKRIESDIFRVPTEAERRLYAGQDAAYYKPRSVTVIEADGIERDPMVAAQTNNPVYLNGDSAADREAFIKEGMAALNGKMSSFIEWQAQRNADNALMHYITTLIEFYMLGPVVDPADGKTYQATKEELAEAFIKIMASYTLDEFDVMAAQQLANDGRFDRTFFLDKMFEANGARLPFFYHLMVQVKGLSGLKLELADGGMQAQQALKFAQTLNNLRPFVFEPSSIVKTTVKKHYGDRAHAEFRRVGELFEHLKKLERDGRDISRFDKRLALPLYLIDGQPVTWYSPTNPLVDVTKANDFKIGLDDFSRRTGNFYETKEKVNLP